MKWCDGCRMSTALDRNCHRCRECSQVGFGEKLLLSGEKHKKFETPWRQCLLRRRSAPSCGVVARFVLRQLHVA